MNPPLEQMIYELGSEFTLRIEKWRNNEEAWRVGLNWDSDGTHDFLCEKESLFQAIECCYLNRNKIVNSAIKPKDI